MSKLGSKQDIKRVDWDALELEYVFGVMTMRELASKHEVNDNTLRSRAVKHDWDGKRNQKRTESTKAVEESLTDERIALQINQNNVDLSASDAVRVKALELMLFAEKPADIKAISGALKDAQAMARLALGMTTENNGQGDFNGNKLENITRIELVAGK